MRDFFVSVWRTFVVLKDLVFGGLAVLLLIALALVFLPKAVPIVPDKAALVLNIEGFLVEQRSSTNPIAALGDGPLTSETLLRDVLSAIDRATSDDRIAALTIETDGFLGAAPGTLETVGRALKKFRATGKPIYTYGRFFAEPQFYLASFSDEIWLHPMGALTLRGYGSYSLYYKTLLDKLKVSVNVFKAGRYKSFVEPFDRTDMSPDARESTQTLLNDLWSGYIRDVETSRTRVGFKVSPMIDEAQARITAAGGDLAKYALDSKAVDRLGEHRAFTKRVASLVGEGDDQDGLPSYSQILMDDYLAATNGKTSHTGDAIGIVYVSGEIIDGDAPPGVVGGDTVSRLIYQALQNDDIKALVVRIDSPGGSTTASEAIREALDQAKAKNIPVVASMGGVAASGGYWIASGADEIWAEGTTITGSIGVFGIIPTFEGTLGLLGVKSDGVGTTRFAGDGDITRAFSPETQTILQTSVEGMYKRFLGIVSKSRKLPVTEVDRIAQGRPWSGATARKLKLVDHLGGVDDAVKSAARRAGLSAYQVKHIEAEEPWETTLLRQVFGSVAQVHQPLAQKALGINGIGLAENLRQVALAIGINRASQIGGAQSTCLECMSFTLPKALESEDIAALGVLSQALRVLQKNG